MHLFIFYIVFLVINCIVLYIFQERSIIREPISNRLFFLNTNINFDIFIKGRKKNIQRYFSPFTKKLSFLEKRKFIESKRLQDLEIERSQLENKLKMLNYISDFELYLSQNKIDKSKFCKMREFLDLKVATQMSILKSTERISFLNATH